MKKILSLVFFVFVFSFHYSQSKIRGTVIDEEFNDPMPYANVIIKGTSNGVTTDFDGKYSLNVQPGTYTLVFSFVGYNTKEITDVVVKENEVKEINVNLSTTSVAMEEVVISVSAKKNTEQALLKIQKKSANLMDGLSSENFKKVGVGDLASAVKRAPGVSLQGGKYVYVRGLGDRYTKSILNGLDIPGLDPDRNTIQMDLFPTNIIDNVLIFKSASADKPADFTGGIVDIITKDFPTKKTTSISVSAGYNPSMHFNSDYLSYEGGKIDFLGFDDGSRALPLNYNLNAYVGNTLQDLNTTNNLNANLPNVTPSDYEAINTLSSIFNPNMSALRTTSLMNGGFGFSSGNQFDIGENKLGLLGSLSYKNTTEFYKDAQNNFFNRSTNTAVYELDTNRAQKGDLGINNVIISGLLGVSYKTEKSKYKVNLLHIQNGESKAGYFRQQTRFSDNIDLNKDNLEYTERSISNILFAGTHKNKDNSLTTEWKIAPTLSRIHDKDIRTSTFQDEDGIYSFQENTEPKRIWRYLNEINLVSRIDFTKTYKLFDEKSKFKFGALGSFKSRDFSIAQFSTSSTYTSVNDWSNYNGIADNIFSTANLVSANSSNGTFINPNTTIIEGSRKFESYKTNFAGYVSNEIKLFGVLRTIMGLRTELFDMYYTGKNTAGTETFNSENVISKIDLFPSLNLIYQLSEDANLRTSYSRTTARPSFKEASIAEIYDPLSNMTFIGNIDIKPSYIQNLDLRYEFFGESAQMIALSGFYKFFKDPIEMTYFESAPTNFTPRNLGEASVFGIEIEVRKNFGFISKKLENIELNVNASLIESALKFSDIEYNLRLAGLREGETLGNSRPLQGQSPYLINVGLNYGNSLKGLQFGLFYNVQGKTLQVVGTGFYPDVYTMPFHSLNFNLNKTLGEERRSTINFRVNNLLGDEKESRFQSFQATDQYFSLRNPGRVISFGYSYKF